MPWLLLLARKFACDEFVYSYVGRIHNGTNQSFDNEACAARSGRKEGINHLIILSYTAPPVRASK